MAEPESAYEAAKRRRHERAAGTPPNRTPTAPMVPVQPEPDVREAESRLRSAADEAYSLQQPGIPAATRAAARVEEVLDRPAPIPSKPTLHESAVRALTPHRLTQDERPSSYVEEYEQFLKEKGPSGVAKDLVTAPVEMGVALGGAAGRKLAGGVNKARELLGYEPLQVPEEGTGLSQRFAEATGIAGAAPKRLEGAITTPEEAMGSPTENTAIAALRILGSTIPAVWIETAERFPTPDYSMMVAATKEPTLADALTAMGSAFWNPSNVAEEIGGYDPGAHQKVRRTDELPGADWLQGILERIETGSGLETVTQEFARQRLGEQFADAGWWVGLGLDTFTNWEGAAMSGPEAVNRIASATKRLESAVPEAMRGTKASELLKAMGPAIAGNEVSAMRELGERTAAALEDGKLTPEQLPARWRILADNVALTQHDLTLRELMQADGIDVGPGVVDVPFQAAAAELEAARAANRAADRPPAPPVAEPPLPPPAVAPGAPAPKPKKLPTPAQITAVQADIKAMDELAAQYTGPTAAPELIAKFEAKLKLHDEKIATQKQRAAELSRAAPEVPTPATPADITRAERLVATTRKRVAALERDVAKFGPDDPAGSPAELAQAKKTLALRERQVQALRAPPPVKGRAAAAEAKAKDAARIVGDMERERVKLVRELEHVRTTPAAAEDPTFLADLARRRAVRVETLRKMVDEVDAARAVPKPPRPSKPMPEGAPGEVPGVFAERQKRETRGPRDEPGEERLRPHLPNFPAGTQINTASDFVRAATKEMQRPDAHPLGYDIGRHEGYERFADKADRTIERKRYNLRNMNGDVIADGLNFPQAVKRMTKRQLDGDRIFDDDVSRPVASWGARDAPKLTTDRWFASKEERAIVQIERTKNPEAIPGRLRQLQAEAEARKAAKAVGGELLERVTGAPSRPQVPSRTRTADVLREVARLEATDLIGSDRLRVLGNGALVGAGEADRINRRADEILGMNGKQARGAILAGQLTAPEYRQRRNAALLQAGGAVADTRYRVQGILPIGRKLMLWFSDPHLQRFKPGKRWRTGITDQVWRSFSEDVLARMPERVRETWKGLETTLARNADEMVGEVKEELKVGGTAEEVLRRVIERVIGERYPTVHPEQLDKAERLFADRTQLRNPAVLDELRRDWKGPRPQWLDSDEGVLAASGVYHWARDARETAAEIARDWIRAALGDAGVDAVGTHVGQQVRELTTDELVPVYREVVHRGATDAPSARPILARFGVTEAPSTQAVVQFALALRAKSKVVEALDTLFASGGAVRPNDIRLPALQSALLDQHRTWDPRAKRWEYKHTEAQTVWAEDTLRDWGIEPGAGTPLRPVSIAGTSALVPEFLRAELESISRSGALGKTSRDLTANKAVNNLMRMFKESVTHGVIAPNPGYYLGQLIGMLPTLVTTRGWKGAAATLGTPLFRRPALTGELVKRAGGVGVPLARARTPEAEILMTPHGPVHVDELEEVMRKHGLNETRPAFEVAENLAEIIARADPRSPIAAGVAKIRKGYEWWQEILRKGAGAVDLNARIGTYIDLVERGMPLDAAALEAKRAVLDFRDLTSFERDWMRLFVTFYAFLRKNADAHVRALLTHPERVASQARLAHASITRSGLTNLELGSMTDADVGRLSFNSDDEVVDRNGRPHPLYALNRITSTPIGVSEWLMQMRALTSPLTLSPQGGKDLVGQATPLLQALAIFAMGRKLDREFDSPMANKVPPILMDLFPGLMRDTFGVGPVLLRPEDDPADADPDATEAAGGGTNFAVWAAGSPYTVPGEDAQARKRQMWQSTIQWLSRPINLAELAYETAGFEPLPPHMSQWDGTRDLLLGTSTRPVVTETEAVRRVKERKVRELRADEAAIRPPKGVGPR